MLSRAVETWYETLHNRKWTDMQETHTVPYLSAMATLYQEAL